MAGQHRDAMQVELLAVWTLAGGSGSPVGTAALGYNGGRTYLEVNMSTTQQALEQALQALAPSHMELVNESYMHSVPPGSESHFKAVLVSEAFAGLNAVKRHQAVYRVLGPLMQQIHALALHTYTAEEWQARQQAPASPNCLGGSKADA